MSPSPHLRNLRAFSLIPLVYISSFVLLPSRVALSVLSFSASVLAHSPDFFFPKPPVALGL